MSQGLREMLANRRFAIPLIVLLAFCFVGLILVGVVLILKPGAPDQGTEVQGGDHDDDQGQAGEARQQRELARFGQQRGQALGLYQRVGFSPVAISEEEVTVWE